MNPMSLLSGAGGGISSSASSSASGQSGDAGGMSGTGAKNISFGGGNPNTVGGFFSNPVVLIALVAGAYFVFKK